LYLLNRVIALKPGERNAFVLLFLYYFCLVALTISGKTARDTYFLSRYDKTLLPIMFGASAASVAIAVAVCTRLANRLGGRAALNVTNGLFALSLVALQGRIAGIVVPFIYVWIEVITVITMLQFWLLAANIFDPRQAKRLYGPIAGGGSLGAIVAGLALKPFVSAFGSGLLLYLVAGLVSASWMLAHMVSKLAVEPPAKLKPANAAPSRKLDRYLLCVAVAIAMAAVVTTVVDYQFKIFAAKTFSDEARLVSFFGSFYAATGVSTLLVQFAVTGFILSRFGILTGLLVLPLLLNIGVTGVLLSPGLASAIFAKFSDQTLKFTLANASMELLWLPVSASRRLAAKPFISGTIKSLSEGAAGVLMFSLASAVELQKLSLLALGAIVIWIVAVFRLRTLYVKEITRAVESGRISFRELRIDVRDPVMVSTIDRTLSAGDEHQILFALHLVEGMSLKPWAHSLQRLLSQGSLAVKKRILELAGDSNDVLTESAIAAAIIAGDAASPDAVMVAGRRKLSIFLPYLQSMLASPKPELRAAAAAALKMVRPEAAHEADDVLAAMLSSEDPAFVAAAVHRLSPDTTLLSTAQLIELVDAPDRAIRSAVLRALGQRADPAAVLPMIHAIDGRSDLSLIRGSLRMFPPTVVARQLASEIDRHGAETKRASALIRTLADYRGDEFQESLLRAVNPLDLDLCEAASEGLLRSARATPAGVHLRAALTGRISSLAERAYFSTRILALLPKDPDAALIRDYYENQFRRTVTVIVRLSAVRVPTTPIETCIHIIQARDRRRLPFVLELLDRLLGSHERQVIYPLIEAGSVEECDQAGSAFMISLPTNLGSCLLDNIINGRPWIAAVSFDYVSRRDPQLISSIETSRPAANRFISEAAHRMRSSSSPAAPEVRASMYTTLEKAVFLKSVGLFQNISAERVADIAQVADEIQAPANMVLFREGDQGDSLYIVLSGCVRVHKGHRDLALLTQGGCLGEMAVLDQEPRSADATIVEDSTLLKIDQEAFYDVLSGNQELMYGIVRLLTSRLRTASERLAAASTEPGPGLAP
jgi:ATP/ADP translocase